MQYGNGLTSVTPCIVDTCEIFNLPGWTPIPGVQLVKNKEIEQYEFINIKDKAVIYRFCLTPYQGEKRGDKPAMCLDVKESPLRHYEEKVRRFPYAAFFQYLLSRYTIVLQHNRQDAQIYRFWFRRLSWALTNGYTLLMVDRKKGCCQINDWAIFFDVWLGFCRGKLLRSREDSAFMIQADE